MSNKDRGTTDDSGSVRHSTRADGGDSDLSGMQCPAPSPDRRHANTEFGRRMNDQVIAFRLKQLETRTDKIDAAIESVAQSLQTLAAIKAEMQSANAQFSAALHRLNRHGAKIDEMAEDNARRLVQIEHHAWFIRLLTGTVITGFLAGLWALLSHK